MFHRSFMSFKDQNAREQHRRVIFWSLPLFSIVSLSPSLFLYLSLSLFLYLSHSLSLSLRYSMWLGAIFLNLY